MIKNTFTKKFISLFLLITTALSVLGCQNSASQIYKDVLKDQNLTVVHSPVNYDKLDTAYLVTELNSIYLKTTKLLTKTTPTEEKQTSVKQYIKENILPMLESIGITKEEMRQLIYYTQFLLKTAEKSSIIVSQKLLEETYHSYIQVLGSKRAGMLLYRGCVLYLKHQAENNDEHAEALNLQLEQLQTVLGEDAFTEAATVFYFATCLFTQNNKAEENSQFPALTDQELLLLWQRQADHLSSLTLTTEQWKIAGEFFFRLLFRIEQSPFDKNSLKTSLWQTLKNSDIDSIGIGSVIPSFLCLYKHIVFSLTPENIQTLRLGTEKEKWLCIASLASKYPQELLTFLGDFSNNVHLENGEEQALIQNKGLWQIYLTYSQERTSITSEQLCEILCQEILNEHTLLSAIEDYLFTNLPYTTFVFFYERSLTT